MHTSNSPKPGRKPLPANQRRSMMFRLRLNAHEWKVFAGTAEKTGQSMAELVRGAVLEEARRVDAVATRMGKQSKSEAL